MNTRARSSLLSMKKAPLKYEKKKVDMQSGREMDPEKRTINRHGSVKEKKMALQRDVDKLKKKLGHEENIHRALERAFTRPMGAFPRLPPYLPPHTLELVAEVAVLEEEVVRLEEKIVRFRQGLHQEAVNISSFNSIDSGQIKDAKQKQSRSSYKTNSDSAAVISKNLPSLSDEMGGNENQSSPNSSKNRHQIPSSTCQTFRTPRKRTPVECKSAEKCSVP